jgi:tetratricopeptide (TPR) repeat protein
MQNLKQARKPLRRFIEIICLCLLLGGCGTTGGLSKPGSLVPERLGALQRGNGQSKLDASTEAQFREAVELLRAGETSQAEELFKRISDTHPELGGPHLNLALISLADDRLAEAATSAGKATECSPASAPAFNTLGIVLRRQGQLADAEQAYRKAVRLDEGYSLAWRNLGVLYDLYLQRPHEALTAYQRFQALAVEPDKEVAMWINDLTRRFGEGPRSVQVTRP